MTAILFGVHGFLFSYEDFRAAFEKSHEETEKIAGELRDSIAQLEADDTPTTVFPATVKTGDFKLDIAFTRLQTSLNIIAATPKDEKSQRTVMEFLQKRVVPCVAAVGFALGALADSATILEYLGYSPAQIESHEPRKTPEPPASDIPQAVQASDAHPENPQSDE